MAPLAYACDRARRQVILCAVGRGMRSVAIHTMRRIRVNALPARQEAVKVIVEPAAVDDLLVAFRARVIAQLVQRDGRLVITAAVKRRQVLEALL